MEDIEKQSEVMEIWFNVAQCTLLNEKIQYSYSTPNLPLKERVGRVARSSAERGQTVKSGVASAYRFWFVTQPLSAHSTTQI